MPTLVPGGDFTVAEINAYIIIRVEGPEIQQAHEAG